MDSGQNERLEEWRHSIAFCAIQCGRLLNISHNKKGPAHPSGAFQPNS